MLILAAIIPMSLSVAVADAPREVHVFFDSKFEILKSRVEEFNKCRKTEDVGDCLDQVEAIRREVIKCEVRKQYDEVNQKIERVKVCWDANARDYDLSDTVIETVL